MNGLIAIEVSEQDAVLFRTFMRHYDLIKFMADKGVFELTQGECLLKFDSKGECRDLRVTKHHFPAL